MKQHIVSLPHHPKRVIIISLIIALIVGIFGYMKINQKPNNLYNQSNLETATNEKSNISSEQNLTLGFLSGGRIKSVSVKAGDTVKKGQVLAELDAENTLGALTQAKAAYQIAQANYQKIINGATGTAVDVAKATVNTAEVNLNEITKQQTTLVGNAYRNLLNSTPEAVPYDGTSDYVAPIISGNYNLNKEGTIKIIFYYSAGGVSFSISGLTQGSGSCNTINSQPLGDSGLYIKCSTTTINIADWNIEIPNKKASNYLTNYNAYQLALQTKEQTIANAQATLDQANVSLAALVSVARPEDLTIAQAQMNNAEGAVQIAQAAYQNMIITAPSDGTVVSVAIAPGQIAIPNASAIEFISLSSAN